METFLERMVSPMKLSARNVLKGQVKGIVKGMVNTEVTVALPSGQEITSVITKASSDRLGLREGMEVFAVVKATSVMLAVE